MIGQVLIKLPEELIVDYCSLHARTDKNVYHQTGI